MLKLVLPGLGNIIPSGSFQLASFMTSKLVQVRQESNMKFNGLAVKLANYITLKSSGLVLYS